jgi:hypothetical protein
MWPPSAIAGTRTWFITQDREQVDLQDRGPAVGVHVGEQLVPGDAGVVDDDVEAAMAGHGVLDDAGPGVVGGHVELPGRSRRGGWRPPRADRWRRGCRRTPRWRRPEQGRARDGGPDAAGGTGNDGDLAGERGFAQSPGPERAARARKVEHLGVDIGRAAGEQEPQGASRASSAPSATRTVLAVPPARISLPIERTMPSRARRAAAWATRSHSSTGRPRTTTRPVGWRVFRAGPGTCGGSRGRPGTRPRTGRGQPRPPRSRARGESARRLLRATPRTCATSGASPWPVDKDRPRHQALSRVVPTQARGRGRPRLLASCLPTPLLTNLP